MPEEASYSTATLRIISTTGDTFTATIELEGKYEDLPAFIAGGLMSDLPEIALRTVGGGYVYIVKDSIAFAEILKGLPQ